MAWGTKKGAAHPTAQDSAGRASRQRRRGKDLKGRGNAVIIFRCCDHNDTANLKTINRQIISTDKGVQQVANHRNTQTYSNILNQEEVI